MLTKRWLILVAIFLLGTTTNSLSAWGQNTHFQGGNWLEEWLSGPLPGQPQQSTTNNQKAMVPPIAEVSNRSDITLHRKSQETAQRSSVPYNRGEVVAAGTDAHAQNWYFTATGSAVFAGDSTGVASSTNNGGGIEAANEDLVFYSTAGSIKGDVGTLKLEDFWYLRPLNKALDNLGRK